MNKLLGVLILPILFLGLGISCASAANVVSFNPPTVEMYQGTSQDIQLVIDSVPGGLSGFNITISVLDPEIAEISGVSFPSWNTMPRNSTIPSSSVWIKGLNVHTVKPGDNNILLGTITLTGKKIGTADLGISIRRLDNETGSSIAYSVIPGKVYLLDNEPPIISYVSLSNSKPNTGDSIVVTVNATDNVGVSSIKANNVPLLFKGGSIWNGSITAIEGTHSVNVSAVDGAGNIAWNNSTSYTAVTPDKIPPSSITNLQSTNGINWINWTWKNPKDTDFNHTEIYLNGTFQINTSAEYFNATGLMSGISYTLSTKTVDNNGNVNNTWVNSTAITGKKTPQITSITPTQTTACAFDLTINGNNFDSGAVDQLYWKADGHYLGSGIIKSLSSSQIVVVEYMTGAEAGVYVVKVKNSDGTISNGIDLTIIQPNETTVYFNPQTIELHQGSSQNVQIVMDKVPTGLSGFNITISILDPEIVEITAVSPPDWAGVSGTSTVPSSSVWIKAADLNGQVGHGDTNFLLGTINLTGKKAGTTDLSIPKTSISDENGNPMNPAVIVGKVRVVNPIEPFPGCTKSPTDLNNDGLYEDINGNGRWDFADVVIYFNNMAWISQNGLVAYFDYNHNGRIDFNDVVRLFNML